MRLSFFCLLLLCFHLFSCDNTSQGPIEDGFEQDTIIMDPIFKPFENEKIVDILAQAGLCKKIPKDSLGEEINMFDPPCMANFYNLIQINPEVDVEECFAVIIASGVHDFPLRRTILFVKEKGKYVMMNRFVGDIVEMRTSKSGYYDLLIRHRDVEAGSFAVKYVFKNGKYHPDKAEEVNDSMIKKALIDSLSPIIIDRILDKKMYQ